MNQHNPTSTSAILKTGG